LPWQSGLWHLARRFSTATCFASTAITWKKLPLTRRKEILASQVDGLPNINLSEHIQEHGMAFFRAVTEKGL
jgi:hypothetical protein